MNPFAGPSQPIGGDAVTSRDEGRAQAAPLQPHWVAHSALHDSSLQAAAAA